MSTLFIAITILAFVLVLYTRAAKRVDVCKELHELGCPVVCSRNIAPAEYEEFLFRSNLSDEMPNEITLRGTLPAILGSWERDGFTVFVDASRLSPIYNQEKRIRELIIELEGVDTVVIGAGENPNILVHPEVAKFVDGLRRQHPGVKIVAQRFTIVG